MINLSNKIHQTSLSSDVLNIYQAFSWMMSKLSNRLSGMWKYNYRVLCIFILCFELMKINLNHTLTHSLNSGCQSTWMLKASRKSKYRVYLKWCYRMPYHGCFSKFCCLKSFYEIMRAIYLYWAITCHRFIPAVNSLTLLNSHYYWRFYT